MPKVSVIIPNYNHGAFLNQRIESVLNQTYQDFEIIILDDCSTDNSKEIIEQYSNHPKVRQIIYNEQNSGSTFSQWKKGISVSSGSLIWMAESDDYCEANFLEIIVPLIKNDADISLAYCKSIRVNEKDEYLDDLSFWYEKLNALRWKSGFVNNGKKEILNYLAFKNTIPNASAVIFRKDVAMQVGNEIEKYRLSGDWLFWIQLLQSGNILYSTNTVNYFRTHSNSVRNYEEQTATSIKERKTILEYLVSKKLIDRKKAKSILITGNEKPNNGFIRFTSSVKRLLKN